MPLCWSIDIGGGPSHKITVLVLYRLKIPIAQATESVRVERRHPMLRHVTLGRVLPSLAVLLCVVAASPPAPPAAVDPESGKLLFVDKAVRCPSMFWLVASEQCYRVRLTLLVGAGTGRERRQIYPGGASAAEAGASHNKVSCPVPAPSNHASCRVSSRSLGPQSCGAWIRCQHGAVGGRSSVRLQHNAEGQ